MKNLKELYSKITPIASVFGIEVDEEGKVVSFPKTASDDTCFEKGFPSVYSTAKSSSGKDILRTDMNKFGDMATRELFFREAGGHHTFNSEVSTSFLGYPEGAVLEYDDGECVRAVESTFAHNDKNFLSDPTFIDTYVKKTNASSGDSPVIPWASCANIYGINEDLFRVGVDFSSRNSLSPGEVLTQDSLVTIGYKTFGNRTRKTEQEDLTEQMRTLSAVVTITDNANHSVSVDLANRGKHGYTYKYSGISIFNIFYFIDLYVYDPVCGCGNYATAFFAKKGWSVSFKVTLGGVDGSSGDAQREITDGIFSYALKTGIGSQE